ncbi:hypothetical protein ACH5RR_006916 [Cinchona calisaya]|uniref:Uncharacterized protein n=1 Tax=Cinchona calisaya TaxID=153742 RepID=A0ABD3AQE6_9GENT
MRTNGAVGIKRGRVDARFIVLSYVARDWRSKEKGGRLEGKTWLWEWKGTNGIREISLEKCGDGPRE